MLSQGARRISMTLLLLLGSTVGAASAGATWSENRAKTFGEAKLRGVAPTEDASGHASLVMFPRHAEIALERLRGLPRERKSAFMIWLATGRNQGYVGGAFPRSSASGGLDAIVPGRRSPGYRNVRAAERLVITVLKTKRARRLAEAERKAHWDRQVAIRGDRVMRGKVVR